MAQLLDFTDTKTYATRANAIKAFRALVGNDDVRFVVVQNEDGRFSPVAIGQSALTLGIHFHFPVVG